jgi:multicomponent Na+:H+ antiporter subunit E
MKVLLLNLMLMALWVASTGIFTYSNGLLGFAVGFLTLWWLQSLVGPSTYFRKLPLAFWFGVLFLWDVFKANLRVAWDVVTPKTLRKPGIVAVPLDTKTDLEIAVLANMITLTPGSLCLEVSEDRRHLYVHEMFVEDPDQVRRQIKQRFEHWVLTLLR